MLLLDAKVVQYDIRIYPNIWRRPLGGEAENSSRECDFKGWTWRLPVTPMILIQGQLEKNIEFLLKLYLCSVFSPPCLYCDEISDAYSWLKGCDMTFFSRSFIKGHGQSD